MKSPKQEHGRRYAWILSSLLVVALSLLLVGCASDSTARSTYSQDHAGHNH